MAEPADPVTTDPPHHPLVVVVCTGNAARSVMAAVMLQAHGVAARVVSAGTHVVENQPISIRTRQALAAVGLDPPSHRSRQLSEDDVEVAELVVAMAAEHVRFVRRRHPVAAGRTATMAWLAAHLSPGPDPLGERVAALGLADVDPEVQGDVADPAGGTDEDYLRCAEQVRALVEVLAPSL